MQWLRYVGFLTKEICAVNVTDDLAGLSSTTGRRPHRSTSSPSTLITWSRSVMKALDQCLEVMAAIHTRLLLVAIRSKPTSTLPPSTLVPSTCIPIAVSLPLLGTRPLKSTDSEKGGQPIAWGDLWVTTHGAACANASKPCLLEECMSAFYSQY
jgi:hypothetical protein